MKKLGIWISAMTALGYSWGDAKARDLQPRPGNPLSTLPFEPRQRFQKGKELFQREFFESEGLGPIFNQRSCVTCHNAGGIGGAGQHTNARVVRFGQVSPSGVFDPLDGSGTSGLDLGGVVLQFDAIRAECTETMPSAVSPNQLLIAIHDSTPTFGLGLIEAIPDQALQELEFRQQFGGIVNGRIHWVRPLESPQILRAGRFGWKAQAATIRSFSAEAALNELGLTSELKPDENRPNGTAIQGCDTVADPEDGPGNFSGFEGESVIDRLSDFQRYLAPPPQTPRSGMRGEIVFEQLGCGTCHTEQFATASTDPNLRQKVIHPYSDFLLHDMASGGDGFSQGAAGRFEMRTAPLWGVALRNKNFHDGSGPPLPPSCRGLAGTELFFCRESERNFVESLLAANHQGEATFSSNLIRSAVQNAPGDVDDLFAFLASLGRIEFDFNFDRHVDLSDLYGATSQSPSFQTCFQAQGVVSPDKDCAIADLNQDGHVDIADLSGFIQAYEGPEKAKDCNCNRQNDLQDILTNVLLDLDRNGIPDSCTGQPCGGHRIISPSSLGP